MDHKERALESIRKLHEKLAVCDGSFPISVASSILKTLSARAEKKITRDEYKNYIRDIDDIAIEFSKTCKCMRTELSLIQSR